jgi:DNA polymerase-3 subunit epsilon
VLGDRAAALLASGPADPLSIVREVCQLTSVPAALAGHLAAGILGADPRFTRDGEGRWLLLPEETAAFDMAIDAMSYVVVDVETTGTRVNSGDRITEIAVVEVFQGRSRVVFDSLINPERAIPAFITSLTAISAEMVKDAPSFRDIAQELAAVLEGNVFVAHNAAFDWRFISNEMQRATGRPLTGTRLCTVRMTRRLVPVLRRRSLDSVAQFFGINIAARHRAGGDAVATAEVLLRLLAAARDMGVATFDQLQNHLRVPRRSLSLPGALPRSANTDTPA